MFFQLPPVLPPAAVMGTDGGTAISANCQKGSRDCFPEDRVGVAEGSVATVLLDLAPGKLALHPEAA
ncbi:hypothetical protein PGN35_018985 [Nodosilinea sp. PGN35]|uniref:hypothetical protein n=1 Tax=Nodosilinea sp. PGN35 TaxID=3020489 RepID=UPI0023B338B6|nr:hypothetical protein [Nodosilinea sp. TSF1-S3]MDF0369817.1 hypothetical protein [Nodosilinea sp. TSF1-S3]